MPAPSLESLRARIRGMERLRPSPWAVGVHPDIDPVLPGGGLAAACLHQIVAGDQSGAATAFAARMAGRLAERLDRPVLWVSAGDDLYPPGLDLDPGRLMLARPPRSDLAWTMEEALKCPGLACVVAEMPALDLVAGRRLHLAAEAGGVIGLALHPAGGAIANAGTTRWRVTSAPGGAWRLALERCRNGRDGEWVITA